MRESISKLVALEVFRFNLIHDAHDLGLSFFKRGSSSIQMQCTPNHTIPRLSSTREMPIKSSVASLSISNRHCSEQASICSIEPKPKNENPNETKDLFYLVHISLQRERE